MRKHGDSGRTRRVLLGMLCIGALSLAGCFVSPNPISDSEQWRRTVEDSQAVFWGQDVPTHSVTLPEAIARAVKYNLDHRLSMMEAAFSMNQLDVANLGMLPRLALNAGYSIRDKESASSSISYENRRETLEPSVSSEVHRINGDLTLSWTLLDFGLSYFQARQQADRLMIMQERRRRIVNNLVKDVITEYFRVATAERMMPKVNETLAQAERALATYQELEENRRGPVNQALEHQRSLVSIISHLRLTSMQLAAARARLAALMNLPLSTNFAIVMPVEGELQPPNLTACLSELETIGVYLRPDLREELYQARIDKYEVKKEMLRMVPGINMFASGNHDSNKYLVHEVWAEAGARVTMDIIGMAAKWKQVKASKAQEAVTRQRRLAATIAAMVQINMSYYQYQQAVELFKDSEKLHTIDSKLLDLSSASTLAREVGELDQIRQSAITLNSMLDRDRQLIEVLTSWGNLYFSIGGDILGKISGTEDINTLTCIAGDSLAAWLSGVLPELPGDAPALACNAIADVRYLDMETVPAVLSVSEDIRKEAEAEAVRLEEEREAYLKTPQGQKEMREKEKAKEKAAQEEVRRRAREEREAALERRRQEVQDRKDKARKDLEEKKKEVKEKASEMKAEVKSGSASKPKEAVKTPEVAKPVFRKKKAAAGKEETPFAPLKTIE